MPQPHLARKFSFRPLLFLLFPVLLTLLALFLLLSGLREPPSAEAEKPSVSWTLPVWPMGVLRGTVEDGTVSTLQVRDPAGGLHAFDRTDAAVVGDGSGLLTGSSVTVAYLAAPADRQLPRALFLAVEAAPQQDKPQALPTRAEQARAILETMTLEEKVGQMFIARCPKSDAPGEAARYALGGYILFTRDFRDRSPEQVTEAISACQQSASIPLFVGVDEEGGSVVRLSKFPAFRDIPFPSPQTLWQSGGLSAVQADTAEKCALLSSLGINLNFAPVCDVSQNPEDYIYSRTLGLDGEEMARYVRAVVEEMTSRKLGCVLKHFPGYGGSQDTHTAVARDDRPYEDFLRSDFLPFRAGIEAGAGMVLVSHNIVSSMDNALPASLSPRVHQILREELGFQGVIVTDDLDMAGAKDFAGVEQSAVLAVQAGNDLLCVTDYRTQIPAVLEAVRAGEIAAEQIDRSVLRILELKLALGILSPQEHTASREEV